MTIYAACAGAPSLHPTQSCPASECGKGQSRRISREVRQALTRAFARRFLYPELLDAWLHLPHPWLGGATSMQRLVKGDGRDVLRAVQGTRYGGRAPKHRRPASAAPILRLLS